MLQYRAHCVGCRQVRKQPATASTLGAGEDIQRESTAQQPAQSKRGVRSFVDSTVAARAGLSSSSPAPPPHE